MKSFDALAKVLHCSQTFGVLSLWKQQKLRVTRNFYAIYPNSYCQKTFHSMGPHMFLNLNFFSNQFTFLID